MAKTLAQVVTASRLILQDESGADWNDDRIEEQADRVVHEVSQKSPCVVQEVLPATEDTKVLDITSITNLLWIVKLEYPIGGNPRNFHNVKWLDNTSIEIDVTSAPSTSGEASTLTGTVTFASGSTAVTGSGTDFDGELEAGYMIKPSGGSRWYEVASITSDTALVLVEPCRAADDGADTVNLTQYCSEPVILHCAELHTLGATSTLRPAEEDCAIQGIVAYCASAWVNNMRSYIKQAAQVLDWAEASIHDITARITQSIADLTSGRAQIDDLRATMDTAIDNMSSRINEAIDNLSIGQTYINKINYGGSPENDYANYAARELQNANTYLNQARGYLTEGTTADRYGAYASRELQNASSYLAQAGGFIRQAGGGLSIANAVNSYQTWANNKLALYRNALNRIAKPKEWKTYPRD
uniref:Uncharacterized protein n=1 Tax=viral metagenome TaxID=1070528 RepID=A0A6M3L425_9ZZZZ